MMLVLVIGLPGTGKTTYCREHLGDGLAYDLDAIASAFRLRAPHEETHEVSRRMANDMLWGFIGEANKRASLVFIIRTAPTVDELEDIAPDRVVFCKTQRKAVPIERENKMRERIGVALDWCEIQNIPIEVI